MRLADYVIEYFVNKESEPKLPEKATLQTPRGPVEIGPKKVENKKGETFDDDIPF